MGSRGTLAHLWDQCQNLACPEVWLAGRGMEEQLAPEKQPRTSCLWARSTSLAGQDSQLFLLLSGSSGEYPQGPRVGVFGTQRPSRGTT